MALTTRTQCINIALGIGTVLSALTVCFCPQSGATALYMAAGQGKVEVVRLLIEAKALVNLPSKVYISLSHLFFT